LLLFLPDAAETEGTGELNAEEQHHPATDIDLRQRHDQQSSNRDDDQPEHTDTHGNKLHELRLRTFCHKYAVVRELRPTSNRETVVCGDKAGRKVVYLSAGNEIEVELNRAPSTDNDDTNNDAPAKPPAVFLLRYDSP